MKPSFAKLTHDADQLFYIRRDARSHLYKRWHFHEELELVLILQSTGMRFVGDHVGTFGPGDLVLLGSMLPHLWLNDPAFFEEEALLAEAVVLHINKKVAETEILGFKEFQVLKSLLERASCGIYFKNYPSVISAYMEVLLEAEDLDKGIIFLQLMQQLVRVEDTEILSSEAFAAMHRRHSSSRLSLVYEFIANNFTRKVSLEEIAEMVCMTPASFCNYFKKKTGKTVFQHINESRISYAKKLLIETDHRVSQVAYTSGFSSISFFNRTFKKITGQSPSEYRAQFAVIKR